MSTIVTDGELGRLAIKQHELFTRVKKGVLPLEDVLAALQSVIEGKDPTIPTLNPEVSYRVWKTIKIGGVKPEVLRSKIDKKKELGDWARDVMKQKAFTTLDAEEEADLIILTPKDFVYTESPRTDIFLDPKRLAEWSAENLDGYVLELCPAEVGPHLREQYATSLVAKSSGSRWNALPTLLVTRLCSTSGVTLMAAVGSVPTVPILTVVGTSAIASYSVSARSLCPEASGTLASSDTLNFALHSAIVARQCAEFFLFLYMLNSIHDIHTRHPRSTH